MKKFTKFLRVFLGVGMIFGGLTAAKLIQEKETSIQTEAEAAVNDTFYYIYNDAYNNSAFNESFKQTLLVFSGTPHGYTEDVVIPAADLGSNILIDGQPLANYAGSIVLPWKEQNWIRIVYPNTAVSVGSTLEIVEGTTIGDSVYDGSTFKLNANGLWRQTFSGEVNATFNSIFGNAAYNCSTDLLIVFNGSPIRAGIAYYGDRILHLDNYLSYNDSSFVYISGTQLRTWDSSAQKWLYVKFPGATAGDKFVIEEGLTVDTAVFERMVFEFNGTEWSKLNLIDDDELVKNSDYMLFTPSDFFGGSNNDWFFFTKVNGTQELDTLNFGLQYNLTLTETELAGYQTLRFGTSLTGNDYLQLLINYKVNTYISRFNGASETITSSVKNINVSEGTHTYEFYSIKVGENSVRFIFGIDGVLIFKTDVLDATGAHCQHIALHSGSTGAAATAYSECAQTKADAIARFTRLKLHSEDISFDDNRDTGACTGENGYYAKAKAFYNTYVTPNQKIEFATGASYANARARFVAWAAANGEALSFNASTGALVIAAHAPLAIVDNKNTAAIILCIVVMSLSLGVVAIWFFRKRKLAK